MASRNPSRLPTTTTADHDKVTLAGTLNYLTLLGQAITLTKLDISDDTNLIAGTGLTLSTNTLSVDDDYVKNTGDSMTGNLLMDNAAGAAILNEASTTTNPTLIPDRSDLTTGWGSNPSATTMDAVIGGVSTLRLGTSGNMKLMVAGGFLRGNDTNAGGIINEASSTTNPTLIPDRADETAGIGGTGGDVDIITGGIQRVNVDSSGVTTFKLDVVMTDEKFIRTGTSDGADNESTGIAGGGSLSSLRGSFVRVSGNEDGNTGKLFLTAGDVVDGEVRISAGGSTRITVLRDGKRGFGTLLPKKDLHIESTVPTIRLSDSDALTDQAVATLIEFYRGNNDNRVGFLGMGSASTDQLVIGTDYAAGEISIRTASNAVAVVIDNSQNFDFQDGNLATTGTLASGNLDVTGTGDFTGNVAIVGATNPTFSATDTTNNCQAVIQATDAVGIIGTTTNHALFVATNSTTAWSVSTGQITTFSGGGTIYNDNLSSAFGTSTDATLLYDGTDLVLNTANIGSGLLKYAAANNWSANGTGNVTISNVGPITFAVATIAKWLTVKDNAGNTMYIPAWT